MKTARPRSKIIDELKLESGIKIQVDRGALTAGNIGPRTPINQEVKQVELRVALRKMLSAQGLRYGIENEVLLITTADKGVGK
jgi:hypothetical protein